MKSKYNATFFEKTDENVTSNNEKTLANTIKMLNDAARLGLESTAICEETIVTVCEQDKHLFESNKRVIKTKNHLNKGDKSLRDMEDACRCILF